MSLNNLSKIADTELRLNTGDTYNDGNYSGKVKEINSDSIVIESQDEDGNIVDITIPKVDDSALALGEPSYDDIMSVLNDPEFICQIIEEASDGSNYVDSYVQNEDGTLDIHIKRPITQEEALYLREVGVSVGMEALNKAGWVTVGVSPIEDSVRYRVYYPSKNGMKKMEFEGSEDEAKGAAEDFAANFGREKTIIHKVTDSDNFEQFIGELLFRKKAKCPKTGDWSIENGKLKNNGNVVGEVSNKSTVDEAFKTIKEAVKKVGKISDSRKRNPLIDIVEQAMTPDGDSVSVDSDDIGGPIKKEWIAEAKKYAKRRAKEEGLEIAYCDGGSEEYDDGSKYYAFTIETYRDYDSMDWDEDEYIGDSALRTVRESNITDILDKGETTVVYDPEETNPSEIVSQIEDELSQYLAYGEELPELEVEILSDNKITVFIS